MTRLPLLTAILAFSLGAAGARAQALDAPDPVKTPGDVRTGTLHAARPALKASVIREVARGSARRPRPELRQAKVRDRPRDPVGLPRREHGR
jgi:hypothetical protein